MKKPEPGVMANFADSKTGWNAALLHALPITGFILALMFRWFALSDRYIVFLYHHDMGPLYPDTGPFSRVTSSRYWMTGLVAGGAVLLLYSAVTWSLGRFRKTYRPPPWQRLWGCCSLLLVLATPILTMRCNEPTLPIANAAQVTAATILAVGLALGTGDLLAHERSTFLWSLADGLGIGLILNNLVHLEKLGRWLNRGATLWVSMMIISLTAALFWLLVISFLGVWRRRPVPPAGVLLITGFSVAYLLLPLLHHLVGTDGYYYISDSDNFFAMTASVQLAVWLATAGLALAFTRLRIRLSRARQRAS